MTAVDEGFAQVDLSAIAKVLGERPEYLVEDTLTLPLLESIVTRLVRRVPTRQVRPRCTSAQDPKDAVEHVSRITPRAPATPGGPCLLRLGNALPNRRPLLVGEIHPEGTNTFCFGWK